MRGLLKKPLFIFFALSILIATPLFLLPLNLFDGEIIYQNGLSTIVEPRPLSLHFVSGIEYWGEPLEGVKDYHLTPRGRMLAVGFIIGFPALIAFRIFLKNSNDAK